AVAVSPVAADFHPGKPWSHAALTGRVRSSLHVSHGPSASCGNGCHRSGPLQNVSPLHHVSLLSRAPTSVPGSLGTSRRSMIPPIISLRPKVHPCCSSAFGPGLAAGASTPSARAPHLPPPARCIPA